MRLDRFLCECGIGTRSEVKKLIKRKMITVNHDIINDIAFQVNENEDKVIYNHQELIYQEHVYIMMNKPKGVVCSNDTSEETVFDLISLVSRHQLFSVGRLDKDTTGLLIISDDGQFSHMVTSPKNKIYKTYVADLKMHIDDVACQKLEEGIELSDGMTLPAKIKKLNDKKIEIQICEGRYHQIKRMLHAVNNEVVALSRVAIGVITLDPDLSLGEWRELHEEEIKQLCQLS